MKIIYEQGDIIFNKNNHNYGIVVVDREVNNYKSEDTVQIVELGDNMFLNNVPKRAVEYCGHIDLKNAIATEVKL